MDKETKWTRKPLAYRESIAARIYTISRYLVPLFCCISIDASAKGSQFRGSAEKTAVAFGFASLDTSPIAVFIHT